METAEDDNDFEMEMEELRKTFPDAKFTISIPLDALNDVISNHDTVVIKITHNCYCYSGNRRKDDLILVHNTTGEGITNKDAIEAMIEYGYDPNCSHVFFEGFINVKDCLFKAYFGS